MTSVIGTPFARAPRNLRTKNPQVVLKNKEAIQGSSGIFQNSELKCLILYYTESNLFFSVTDVVLFMEHFNELAQSNSPEKDLRSAVLTLCANLKNFGAQLEMNCKGKAVHVFFLQSVLMEMLFSISRSARPCLHTSA